MWLHLDQWGWSIIVLSNFGQVTENKQDPRLLLEHWGKFWVKKPSRHQRWVLQIWAGTESWSRDRQSTTLTNQLQLPMVNETQRQYETFFFGNETGKTFLKTFKVTTNLSRNSFELVARHDDNFDLVVPEHLPEVKDRIWHWTLGCDVPLSWIYSLHSSHTELPVNQRWTTRECVAFKAFILHEQHWTKASRSAEGLSNHDYLRFEMLTAVWVCIQQS